MDWLRIDTSNTIVFFNQQKVIDICIEIIHPFYINFREDFGRDMNKTDAGKWYIKFYLVDNKTWIVPKIFNTKDGAIEGVFKIIRKKIKVGLNVKS